MRTDCMPNGNEHCFRTEFFYCFIGWGEFMITEAIELWKQNAITSWMNFDVKTEKIWSATHSSSRGLWRSSPTRGPLTKSAKQSGSWNPNSSKQRPMKLWGIHTQSEPFDVGLLKIQFLHPQKKPEEGRPKCAFSSPGPTFLRHFLVGQFCAQNKNSTTAVPQASQSVRQTIRLQHGSQRCLYTAIHRDRASPGGTERGIPLVIPSREAVETFR